MFTNHLYSLCMLAISVHSVSSFPHIHRVASQYFRVCIAVIQQHFLGCSSVEDIVQRNQNSFCGVLVEPAIKTEPYVLHGCSWR
ncbi:hypothetical protein B0H14DRAFT_2800143 [Mycena olivaceomarginata]|nr:hypothetical protein B0H14DRAFT_2800143 [Mycena olivaceomarginata]